MWFHPDWCGFTIICYSNWNLFICLSVDSFVCLEATIMSRKETEREPRPSMTGIELITRNSIYTLGGSTTTASFSSNASNLPSLEAWPQWKLGHLRVCKSFDLPYYLESYYICTLRGIKLKNECELWRWINRYLSILFIALHGTISLFIIHSSSH